jgi:hypothetical protein
MIEVDERGYEFNEAENNRLSILSRQLGKLGKIILAAGILLVGHIVLSFIDPQPVFNVGGTGHAILSVVDSALWVVISLLVIYLSVAVIRLGRPIGLIVSTKGADIGHLMQFVEDLRRISRLSFVLLTLACILLAISLVLMLLVF